MKKIRVQFYCLIFILLVKATSGQTIDTLVDVGTYKLHFNIIKGKGTALLFEAGGGDDATTWKNILKPIADITGATLISYDRAGFGKSTLDTNKHGILNGMIGLETGLHKLGYDGDIILIAHSQGGLYAKLYASRHVTKVKAAVLIDATTSCFYEPARLAATQRSIDENNDKLKQTRPGSYYQGLDFSRNINAVRNISFPENIPVTDFVSDYPPFDDKKDIDDWKQCHKDFASGAPNRTGIVAYGCGHFIFEDNRPLVIHAIARVFAQTLNTAEANKVLSRAIAYAVDASNTRNKDEVAYRHSEDDINSWGYELVRQGNLQRALDVFKLNVELHPDSWNVYDSYGETLLKNGQKEEAIKMYKKSVELNPKSENGKKVLERITK